MSGIWLLLLVIKLLLFLACRRVPTNGTQALAQDHRNDVISNTGALACGLIGQNSYYFTPLCRSIGSFVYTFSYAHQHAYTNCFYCRTL